MEIGSLEVQSVQDLAEAAGQVVTVSAMLVDSCNALVTAAAAAVAKEVVVPSVAAVLHYVSSTSMLVRIYFDELTSSHFLIFYCLPRKRSFRAILMKEIEAMIAACLKILYKP